MRILKTLKHWDIGILRYWYIEILEYWDIGILIYQFIRIWRYWDIDIFEYGDIEILIDSNIKSEYSYDVSRIIRHWNPGTKEIKAMPIICYEDP